MFEARRLHHLGAYLNWQSARPSSIHSDRVLLCRGLTAAYECESSGRSRARHGSIPSMVTDTRQPEPSWDPASWSVRTCLIVFVFGAVAFGIGISQAVLRFGHVEHPGRAGFLVFWAVLILAICLFALLCMRMGDSVFRGALVIAPRPGESQGEADTRADAQGWAISRAVVTVAGLICYAFIVWQAVRRY
jgi:hypothetical protein